MAGFCDGEGACQRRRRADAGPYCPDLGLDAAASQETLSPFAALQCSLSRDSSYLVNVRDVIRLGISAVKKTWLLIYQVGRCQLVGLFSQR